MTATCPNGHSSASDDYCDVCGAPIAAGTSAGSAPAGTTPAPAASAEAAPAGSSGSGMVCPNCETPNVADALFCEACGYDFTTGTMPRSAVPLTPPDGAVVNPSVAPGEVPPTADSPAPDTGQVESDLNQSGQGRPDQSRPGEVATNVSAEVPFSWVAEVWIDPVWYEAQESPDAIPSAGLPAVVPLRNKSVLIGRKSKSRNINPDIDCEPDTGTSRRQAQLTTDGTRWWVEDLESSNGTFVGAASEPLPEDPIPVGPKRELKPDDRIYIGAWTRLVIREATEDELSSLG